MMVSRAKSTSYLIGLILLSLWGSFAYGELTQIEDRFEAADNFYLSAQQKSAREKNKNDQLISTFHDLESKPSAQLSEPDAQALNAYTNNEQVRSYWENEVALQRTFQNIKADLKNGAMASATLSEGLSSSTQSKITWGKSPSSSSFQALTSQFSSAAQELNQKTKEYEKKHLERLQLKSVNQWSTADEEGFQNQRNTLKNKQADLWNAQNPTSFISQLNKISPDQLNDSEKKYWQQLKSSVQINQIISERKSAPADISNLKSLNLPNNVLADLVTQLQKVEDDYFRALDELNRDREKMDKESFERKFAELEQQHQHQIELINEQCQKKRSAAKPFLTALNNQADTGSNNKAMTTKTAPLKSAKKEKETGINWEANIKAAVTGVKRICEMGIAVDYYNKGLGDTKFQNKRMICGSLLGADPYADKLPLFPSPVDSPVYSQIQNLKINPNNVQQMANRGALGGKFVEGFNNMWPPPPQNKAFTNYAPAQVTYYRDSSQNIGGNSIIMGPGAGVDPSVSRRTVVGQANIGAVAAGGMRGGNISAGGTSSAGASSTANLRESKYQAVSALRASSLKAGNQNLSSSEAVGKVQGTRDTRNLVRWIGNNVQQFDQTLPEKGQMLKASSTARTNFQQTITELINGDVGVQQNRQAAENVTIIRNSLFDGPSAASAQAFKNQIDMANKPIESSNISQKREALQKNLKEQYDAQMAQAAAAQQAAQATAAAQQAQMLAAQQAAALQAEAARKAAIQQDYAQKQQAYLMMLGQKNTEVQQKMLELKFKAMAETETCSQITSQVEIRKGQLAQDTAEAPMWKVSLVYKIGAGEVAGLIRQSEECQSRIIRLNQEASMLQQQSNQYQAMAQSTMQGQNPYVPAPRGDLEFRKIFPYLEEFIFSFSLINHAAAFENPTPLLDAGLNNSFAGIKLGSAFSAHWEPDMAPIKEQQWVEQENVAQKLFASIEGLNKSNSIQTYNSADLLAQSNRVDFAAHDQHWKKTLDQLSKKQKASAVKYQKAFKKAYQQSQQGLIASSLPDYFRYNVSAVAQSLKYLKDLKKRALLDENRLQILKANEFVKLTGSDKQILQTEIVALQQDLDVAIGDTQKFFEKVLSYEVEEMRVQAREKILIKNVVLGTSF